jgi:hypothetical protein
MEEPFDETIDIDADKVKSADVLYEFSKFCVARPEMGFWQALAVWATGKDI